LETDEELMDHIYSGSRLRPGLQLRILGYCFWGLIITRPTRHLIYNSCFQGLIITRPTRHFIDDPPL